ncbi:MAG: GGDEF domain-containing protein [Candidatus Moranbacteria bacterium]|nr:GGDEF domain-containing protein [Candidatus Moranbacteria bacterium]
MSKKAATIWDQLGFAARRIVRRAWPNQYVSCDEHSRLKHRAKLLEGEGRSQVITIMNLRREIAGLRSQVHAAQDVQLWQSSQFLRDLETLETTVTTATRPLLKRIEVLEGLNVELTRLATQDPLTGLANRRGLDDRFRTAEGVLVRTIRVRDGEEHRKRPTVAAILIDIDHFKRINDTHGHHAGDQVLCGVAKLMRQHLGHRPEDILCRFGGEEFLVVLPHADARHAYIQATLFTGSLREAPLLAGQRVTASAGVAELEINPGATPEEIILRLYHMADRAMYRAKELGRDQVVRYSLDLEG